MRSSTIIAAVLLIAAATLSAQSWGPDVRLTNEPANTQGAGYDWQIAVNGDTVHVVFWDERDGNREVYYKRSLDNGLSWETDKRLTFNSSMSHYTTVAVSGNYVHVAWVDERDGNQEEYYTRSVDGGETWETARRQTYDGGRSQSPSIAAFGSNVHEVWNDSRSGWDIYYKRSADDGATWGSDIQISTIAGADQHPTVAVSGNNLHVVWADETSGSSDIYYRASTDNGNTWGSELKLTTKSGYHAYHPSVAVSGNDVYVVWEDNRDGNYEIYFMHSSDNGLTWGTNVRLTSNSAHSCGPSIAVSDARVYVAWRDSRDGNEEIYFKQSNDNGLSWSADTRLTYASGLSTNASIAVSGDDIHVVWTDHRDGNPEIYYKRYFLYPNIAPLAAVTGTSLHPGGGRDVDKLNDESFSGFWESKYTTGQKGDVWMMYEWPRPYRLEASLFCCSPPNPPHLNLPVIYNIEAWMNGEWQEIAYVVNTDSNKAIFGDDLQDVITTKLRINLIDVRDTDSWGKDVATLSEWQVFGDTVPLIIAATVDFDPNKLNFKSKGKWVTCYIELPEGYSVEDIDESTVATTEIDGTELDPHLYCEGPFAIGDFNENGITDLMVKFDRQALIAILQDMGYDDGELVELTAAGELTDGQPFAGSDCIEVINKGKGGGQSGDPASAFSFEPVSPNPFREQASIRYTLPQSSHVQLVIYDALGRQVCTLADAEQDAGPHTLVWDGCDDAGRALPSSIYFLNFEAGKFSRKAKLVILR